ncbi:MAG: signal peptidase II [Pseudomonadota bacterium]
MTASSSIGARINAGRVAFADWRRAAFANPLFAPSLAGALVVFLSDQLSKIWIVDIVRLPERIVPCAKNASVYCAQIPVAPIFDLTFVRNTGASFGLGAGGASSRIILSSLVTVVVAGLIVWLGGLNRRLAAIGAAFIIGGAVGNLYDRIAYGYVVDFLDFTGLYFPWVFNVADVAINIGIAFLFADAYVNREQA